MKGDNFKSWRGMYRSARLHPTKTAVFQAVTLILLDKIADTGDARYSTLVLCHHMCLVQVHDHVLSFSVVACLTLRMELY